MDKEHTALPLWATILINLTCTALGLLAYHYYATHSLEARDKRLQERITGDIATLAQQTIDRIAGEREKSEQAAVAKALQLERLAGAIYSAHGLRTDIAVYLAEQGKLPQHLDDLQYPPDWLPNQHLEHIRLRRNGAIELQLRKTSGLDGIVHLTPHIQGEYSMIIGWDCTSADFAFIQQAVPDCQHTRTPEKPPHTP